MAALQRLKEKKIRSKITARMIVMNTPITMIKEKEVYIFIAIFYLFLLQDYYYFYICSNEFKGRITAL